MSTTSQGLISSVLSSACTAWLKTQVSTVAEMQVKIVAGDRQMLAGKIPVVTVSAQKTVYRGISLEKIQLVAEQIAVNLGQVLRGKPLKLLHPMVIDATAVISEANLQSSLAAPLLESALNDLVNQMFAGNAQQLFIQWRSVAIRDQRLLLEGQLSQESQPKTIAISTGIELIDGHILRLTPLTITGAEELPGCDRQEYTLDLGDQVNLTEVTLKAGELLCSGKIQVNP